MATQQEIDAGLEYFKLLLPKTRDLRLLSAIRLPDRAAQIITIGTGPKKVSIVFTHKFLSELIARADYQQAATSYIFGVAHRMIHRNPMDFYCMSGIPIQVEIEWPTNIVPTHATSYVRVSNSRYGIVILSPSFLSKGWAQKELDGLVAREVHGKAVILPIWHNLSYPDVVKYSPTLADKVAASSFEGIPVIARKIVDAIRDP